MDISMRLGLQQGKQGPDPKKQKTLSLHARTKVFTLRASRRGSDRERFCENLFKKINFAICLDAQDVRARR